MTIMVGSDGVRARGRSLFVFSAFQDPRRHAVADQFPDRHRSGWRVAAGDAIGVARPQAAGRLASCLLAICGFSPLGNLVLYPLEARFPPWDAARGAPDGIIVLGGSIDADLSAAHGVAVVGARAIASSPRRCLPIAIPTPASSITGGSANLVSSDAREADYAAALFEGLGIARSRLLMERRSRNTQENAEFSKALADSQTRRAMAAGDLRLPHAAIGRPVSQGRI